MSLPGEAVAAHPGDGRARPLLAEGAEGVHAEDGAEVGGGVDVLDC